MKEALNKKYIIEWDEWIKWVKNCQECFTTYTLVPNLYDIYNPNIKIVEYSQKKARNE